MAAMAATMAVAGAPSLQPWRHRPLSLPEEGVPLYSCTAPNLTRRRQSHSRNYPTRGQFCGWHGSSEVLHPFSSAPGRLSISPPFHNPSISPQFRRLPISPTSSSSSAAPSPTSASAQAKPPSQKDKVEVLRGLLSSPKLIQAPACHDALSASLVQQAGFPMAFMSGFAVCGSRAALPDAGLLSYGEMLEAGRLIAGAVGIPVIGDADTGYGSCMNVRRTVGGYRSFAGMAGAIIEDQEWPKACGHTKGRRVVSREEAVMCIRAAVDERNEGPDDIVIVARSDARQAQSLDEALWRVQAFADSGADMVFVDALQSKEEMKALCKAVPNTPKLANMLEGGGRTPILSPMELEDMGFSVVVYPLTLMGACIQAMQDALAALRSGRMPPPGSIPSFEEMKQVVGFPQYYEMEARYAVPIPPTTNATATSSSTNTTSSSSSSSSSSTNTTSSSSGASNVSGGSSSSSKETSPQSQGSVVEPQEGAAQPKMQDKAGVDPPVVEAEYVLPPDGEGEEEEGEGKGDTRRAYLESRGKSGGGGGDAFPGQVMLCVKVTGRDGRVKIDVRVPGGFLTTIARTLPAIAGLDLQGVLDAQRNKGNFESKEMLLDIIDDRTGDRVQISVE